MNPRSFHLQGQVTECEINTCTPKLSQIKGHEVPNFTLTCEIDREIQNNSLKISKVPKKYHLQVYLQKLT